RGPMPLEQFVPFFERVAQVVQAAHDRGIVHRDLKPSNVMLIERGGELYPKLIDFGIAKVNHEIARSAPGGVLPDDGASDPFSEGGAASAQRTRTDPAPAESNLTRSDAGIGSPAYMSPEQWSDAAAVGPATDIYSLGAVAYEVLTGRLPFSADSTD